METSELLKYGCSILMLSWLLGVYYRRYGRDAILGYLFFPALFFKIALGLLLGALYHFYYQGGDTLLMFEDSQTLLAWAQQSPKHFFNAFCSDSELPPALHYADQPRALLFSRLISPVTWLAQGNYWLASAYLSAFGFAAAWYLFQVMARLWGNSWEAAIALLFYPGAAFWSAGIIKECVAFGLICILMAHMLQLKPDAVSKRVAGMRVCALLLCAYLLWGIKYYYAAVVLPCILTIALLSWTNRKVSFAVAAAVLLLLGTGFSFLHPNLHVDRLLQAVVNTHHTMLEASRQGDALLFDQLQPEWMSFVRNFPLALYGGLLRPLPGDGQSWLHLLAGTENLLLGILMLLACFSFLYYRPACRNSMLLATAVSCLLFLSAMLAFASPNFGTLMRYKSVFLPFVLYLSLSACRPLFQGLFQELFQVLLCRNRRKKTV